MSVICKTLPLFVDQSRPLPDTTLFRTLDLFHSGTFPLFSHLTCLQGFWCSPLFPVPFFLRARFLHPYSSALSQCCDRPPVLRTCATKASPLRLDRVVLFAHYHKNSFFTTRRLALHPPSTTVAALRQLLFSSIVSCMNSCPYAVRQLSVLPGDSE